MKTVNGKIIPIYKVFDWNTKKYTSFTDEETKEAHQYCDRVNGTMYKQYYNGGTLFYVYGKA